MRRYLFPSLRLTAVLIVLLAVAYPLFIGLIARLAPGRGDGVKIEYQGKVVGYENIGQKFTADKYFWSRPSAVNYNAAGSGGSNKGPSNPDYLKTVQNRIDTFLVHHPGMRKEEIPAELVTASGSGLDPDLSPGACYVQIPRIAKVRRIEPEKLEKLVAAHVKPPFLGVFGPQRVNVLELNIALDELSHHGK